MQAKETNRINGKVIGHLWEGSFVLLDTVFCFCKMIKLDVDVYHITRSVKTFIKYRIEEHHMCPPIRAVLVTVLRSDV